MSGFTEGDIIFSPVVSALIVLFFILPVFRDTIFLPIIISMCQVFQTPLMENLKWLYCSIIYNGQLILDFCMLNYEIMTRVLLVYKKIFWGMGSDDIVYSEPLT
jgi:hypothetical protein